MNRILFIFFFCFNFISIDRYPSSRCAFSHIANREFLKASRVYEYLSVLSIELNKTPIPISILYFNDDVTRMLRERSEDDYESLINENENDAD